MAPANAAPASASSADLVDVTVTFDVHNVNRSNVPCVTDGGEYQLVGSLVAPASVLDEPSPSITVYLPGSMATVAGLFRQQGFDGHYDLGARMADLGHASLLIDRIGLGESGTPNGFLACVGGDADTVHQVIQQLRTGDYQLGDGAGVAFERVAVAGYSGGGLLAEVEAHSFHDVDAVILMMSAMDQFHAFPASVLVEVAQTVALTCGRGGDRKHADRGPSGYSYVFEVGDSWWHDHEPAVRATYDAHVEREPCGNWASYGPAFAVNRLQLGTIDVPVLLVGAEHDFGFPPSSMAAQRDLFSGSPDVTLVTLANAGHTAAMERGLFEGRSAAERLRIALCQWMTPRGLRLSGQSCIHSDALSTGESSQPSVASGALGAQVEGPGEQLPTTGAGTLLAGVGALALTAGVAVARRDRRQRAG